MSKKSCAIIVPFVGQDDLNFIYKNHFYWFPFYNKNEPNRYKDLFYPSKANLYHNNTTLNRLISDNIKNKEFHFDPYLNGRFSSYAEPYPDSNRDKGARMLRFLNEQIDNDKDDIFISPSNLSAKIYFGAKFQRFNNLGVNNSNTKLYFIGELKVKYAGYKNKMLRKKIPIKSYLKYNAHKKRGDDDYTIFAGEGLFYNKPTSFAKWSIKHNSYKIIKNELKNCFGTTNRIRTSVHLGMLEKDIVKNIV